MFSGAFYKYIIGRSVQSIALYTVRNHAVPLLQQKIQKKVNDYCASDQQKPLNCRTCRYFSPIVYKGEYMIGTYYGNCKLFTKRDMITNLHEPMMAHEARGSEAHCGKQGGYHTLHPWFRQNYPTHP
jgi:hypothetical protein